MLKHFKVLKINRIKLVVLVLISGFYDVSFIFSNVCAFEDTFSDSILREKQATDTQWVQIGFVGDIMAHLTQLNAQKQSDGSYDFSNNYKWVAPIFAKNDVMIGNVETTFAGTSRGYSAYPKFNTPDALADALKGANFDILATANNHMYDTGTKGLNRTLEILTKNNLQYTGSRLSTDQPRYAISQVENTKVGVLAYTYESGRTEHGVITINGIHVKHADTNRLNTFDPWNLGPTVQEMREEMEKMKQDSVSIFVAVMHWGYEYKNMPADYQKALADSLHQLGFHVVFGSHPHVIQPMDILVDSISGHQTYVLYSAGNFISNQRYETLKNYHTEDGVYVELKFRRIGEHEPVLQSVRHEPTWVNRYKKNGKYHYEVMPVKATLSSEEILQELDDAQIQRINRSLERTTKILQVFHELPLKLN